jgi:hypothetical protein
MKATIILNNRKRIEFNPYNPRKGFTDFGRQFFNVVQYHFLNWMHNEATPDQASKYYPECNRFAYTSRKKAVDKGMTFLLEYIKQNKYYTIKEADFDMINIKKTFVHSKRKYND